MLIMSRISFTRFVPSHCFQIADPILSSFASKILSRFINLQKDFPTLLVNFGTVMMTRSSLVVDQEKSPVFGLYSRNSSILGRLLLFVFGVNFPQRDVGKESCDEDPDEY